MKPIRFVCTATLPISAERIAAEILDVAKWPGFRGYGPIPGIESAEFDVQTADVVGSRIRVKNRDGSAHVEEIVEWRVGERLQLRMGDFSPPLSRLASRFVETWDFRPRGNETDVVRTFEMHAKSAATKPLLWLISFFVKRAIARHLRDLGRRA
jgi:hypothetical protein